MSPPPFRHLLAAALAAPLLLAGCQAVPGGDDALPDIDTNQNEGQPFSDKPNVLGFMVSATEKEVRLKMPDGAERVFTVRPEDAPGLGLEHLASHAGFTDVGFRVFYETEDGVDYVLGAFETAPPQ